jgi:prepilin-type processing-associated H-X9-DG protein/prepilin-type N-terminal cleavage/methylation domain-containing protein
MQRRHRVGLTLVELLVVIAILGVLAALLAAVTARARDRARQIQCAGNVRQLGMALLAFVADNDVYSLEGNPGYRQGAYPEHMSMWTTALQYTELSVPGSPTTNRVPFSKRSGETVWKCPAANKPSNWPINTALFSYGYNVQGLCARTDTNSLGLGGSFVWSATRVPAPPVHESGVASPADMMAIGDGFKGGGGVFIDGDNWLWRTYGLSDKLDGTRRSMARHRGLANVVFCDGHVETPTLQFLFTDTSDAALVRWNRDHQPHRELLQP